MLRRNKDSGTFELAAGPTYKYHTLHMLHVTPQNMSAGPAALMCDNDIQETL